MSIALNAVRCQTVPARTGSWLSIATLGALFALVPQASRAPAAQSAPVINVAPRSKSVPAITLKQPALLHVGGLQDNPADEFEANNFTWLTGTLLSDGGLAVADGFKVRLYDKTGRQRAVIGKVAGAGPKEFQHLWRICRTRGDTLFLHDDRNRRAIVMTSSGEIVRENSARDVTFVRMSCLDDGTMIVHRKTDDSAGFEMAVFVRRKTDGSDAEPVGILPISYRALSPVPYVTIAAGREVVVADPNVRDIQVRDVAGKVVRTYRLAEKPSTAPAEFAQQSTVYAAVGIGVEQAGGARETKDRVPWPLYRRLEIDPSGNLWLQDMTDKATERQSWTRVNAAGAVTGRLTLPPLIVVKTLERTEVISFTANGVLLRTFDVDGAAHFYRYAFN